MADTTGRKVQSPLISGSLLTFVVLLVAFLLPIALLSSQVAYAFPLTTQHTKPQFPGLRHTVNAATPPAFTQSRYITPNDKAKPSRLYTDGCNQASSGVGGVVILDFGATVFKNGGYGTYLPGSSKVNPVYISNSKINILVEQYLIGYNQCNSSFAYLTLGIGTNNGVFKTDAQATSDGKEWGTLISNVSLWITLDGLANEEAYGASDIELKWSSAALATAWTNGFLTTYPSYLNYGDASGCPKYDSTKNVACDNGWHQSDVAYVSWNALGALPFPEIYSTSGGNAAEWQSIEYYQHNNQGSSGPMAISGTFTQYKACQQKNFPPDCQGTDNTPAAGWTQLYNDLNANKSTGQELPFSSDIQWDN